MTTPAVAAVPFNGQSSLTTMGASEQGLDEYRALYGMGGGLRLVAATLLATNTSLSGNSAARLGQQAALVQACWRVRGRMAWDDGGPRGTFHGQEAAGHLTTHPACLWHKQRAWQGGCMHVPRVSMRLQLQAPPGKPHMLLMTAELPITSFDCIALTTAACVM